jgi:hypothetical protein
MDLPSTTISMTMHRLAILQLGDGANPSASENHAGAGVRSRLTEFPDRPFATGQAAAVALWSTPTNRAKTANKFGGSGLTPGVCSVARRSAALRSVGVRLRRGSGLLTSSSAIVGTRAVMQ